MTLWTEKVDLWCEDGDRWSVGLKIAVLDRTAILWNKILELLKGVKHLQSSSNFMNKINERFNTALPPYPWKNTALLHVYFVLFRYVSLKWEGVLQ